MIKPERTGKRQSNRSIIAAVVLSLLVPLHAWALEGVDVGSGILNAPRFKGKEPLQKLHMAADLLREKKVKQTDLALAVLDWSDRYIQEATNPTDRLRKWSTLCSDEKLNPLRIPREFLNRMLVADYLISEASYLDSPPSKKLQMLERLAEKKLIDWPVSLAYARLYAGAIITGAKEYAKTTPMEELKILKRLREQNLVGWHYRVPTEAILVAEALAMDPEYGKAPPYDRLLKLRTLEKQGLVSGLTRRDLEKLPVWRLLVSDPSFLAAEPGGKRKRITKLKNEGLITEATCTELTAIFRSPSLAPPPEDAAPAPLPKSKPPAAK